MSRYVRGENEHNESGNNDKSSPESKSCSPEENVIQSRSKELLEGNRE